VDSAVNEPAKPKAYSRYVKIVIRAVVVVLVVWGVYNAAIKARDEMATRRASLLDEIEQLKTQLASSPSAETPADLAERERQLDISPWSVRPMWLIAAAVFYLVGLLPNAVFWRSVLVAMGAQPGWLETLRAYYIGHHGKYVPGKAMVVVQRTTLVSGPETTASVAAVAVFVETLTMMAVGGMLASFVLVFFFQHNVLIVLSIGLAIVAGVPTLPPVFRTIVRILKVKKADPKIESALEHLDYSLMLRGWPLVALGWLLLGLSLWSTLQALPLVEMTLWDSAEHIPVLTACVALAMVLGFVSLLPGGAGVREWVVTTLVAPIAGVGAFPALAAAIWLRIIWLVSEVAISSILYVSVRTKVPGEA